MAKDKKSFVLYVDQKEMVDQLPDEVAGKLFKLIYSYCNDENPDVKDLLLGVAFAPIKQALKRDLKKYEERAERSKENGRKGGRPRKEQINDETQETQWVKKKPRKPDSDSVNDTVIDYNKLIDFFNSVTGKNSRTVSKKVKGQINARLSEGYTKDDIAKALENVVKDDYHKETNLKYVTLEFITRSDKLDKYLNVKPTPKSNDDKLVAYVKKHIEDAGK